MSNVKKDDKVKIISDRYPSGLIGAIGLVGKVINHHVYMDAVSVQFDNGSVGWFLTTDIIIVDEEGKPTGCVSEWTHNYEKYVGFNQVSYICTKCNKKRPVNFMKGES